MTKKIYTFVEKENIFVEKERCFENVVEHTLYACQEIGGSEDGYDWIASTNLELIKKVINYYDDFKYLEDTILKIVNDKPDIPLKLKTICFRYKDIGTFIKSWDDENDIVEKYSKPDENWKLFESVDVNSDIYNEPDVIYGSIGYYDIVDD